MGLIVRAENSHALTRATIDGWIEIDEEGSGAQDGRGWAWAMGVCPRGDRDGFAFARGDRVWGREGESRGGQGWSCEGPGLCESAIQAMLFS